MQYYKYQDSESYDYTFECFVELDEEFYCFRAVYKTPEGLINSFVNGMEHFHGLPEGSWADILDLNEQSSLQEFEKMWSLSMLPYENQWGKLKNTFQIGQMMDLKVICFYPKGVILAFNETFYALANYDKCLKKFGQEKMYPNQVFKLTINGFDDKNKIVLMEVINA